MSNLAIRFVAWFNRSPSGALGLFFMMAVWATWPLSARPASLLLTGSSPAATVPLLSVWTTWWNGHCLLTNPVSYWDAPIFYPLAGSLALTEPQTLSAIPAIFTSDLGSPVLPYNLYLLLNLTLNGWTFWLWLKKIGIRSVASYSGATAILLHPLAFDNLEVCHLFVMWPAFLGLYAIKVIRANRGVPGRSTYSAFGILIAAAVAMLLGSLQHTLMVGLLATLGIFLLLTLMLSERTFQGVLDWLRRHHQPVAAKVVNEKSAYGNLVEWIATCRNLFHSKLVVVTLFLLVLGGILYIQALRSHQSLAGFSRSQYQQLELSADLKDWLTVPKRSLTNQLLTWFGLDDSLTKPQPKVDMGGSTSIFALSPGWCRVILALASIVFACFGLCQHRTTSSLLGLSQLTLGLCCILAWAIVLSMGPASWMNIPSPFTCLAWTFGPLEQMRSPFRFAYWGQSLVIVLAAIAIHWMDQLLRPAEPRTATRGWKSQAATCLTVMLGLTAALEVPPSRSMLFDVPHVMMEQTWLEVMRQNTSEKAPVLCLPCAQDPSEISQQRDALWMLYATLHHRPLVNGYCGFEPKNWNRLRNRLKEFDYTSVLFEELRRIGVKTLVIRQQLSNSPPLPTHEQMKKLKLQILWDDTQIAILSLQPDT